MPTFPEMKPKAIELAALLSDDKREERAVLCGKLTAPAPYPWADDASGWYVTLVALTQRCADLGDVPTATLCLQELLTLIDAPDGPPFPFPGLTSSAAKASFDSLPPVFRTVFS